MQQFAAAWVQRGVPLSSPVQTVYRHPSPFLILDRTSVLFLRGRLVCDEPNFYLLVSVVTVSLMPEEPYRGASPIRKRSHLGPYRKPMPRVMGGGRFLMSEVPL